MILKLILINVLVVLVVAEKVRYDNYALYKVHPDTEEKLKFLNELYEKNNRLDFWKPPSQVNEPVSVVSPPELKEEFEHSLKKRSIRSEITLKNLQEAFDAQLYSRKKRSTSNEIYWTNYQTIEDIYNWFNHLASTQSSVSTFNVGKSHEGRNITGIKITRGSGTRAFFLQGGELGADWLSPTIVTYIANQLIHSNDPEIKAAAEDFTWYILPLVNPDGFQFSQDSVRSWVKNRRPTSPSTIGVDLSKNWNAHWGINGASFSMAANNYAGHGPFSEVETRQVSEFIESIQSSLSGFLSFRSFGQRLLIPYAQYSTTPPDGATGAIADWVKFRYNTTIAATYLLRDTGLFGYALPVSQITPSGEETLDSLLAIIREAKFINVLEKFRFDNYSLYKVLPKNLDQIKVLGDLQHAAPEYDFWDDPVPTADYINIMSKPEMKNDLEAFLNKTGIDFVVTLPNVQEEIDRQKRKPYVRNNIKSMQWDDYYTLEEIYDWLDDLAKAFPDIVSIIIGGTTYEGRDIKGIKISHGPGRRAVFIESGIHAREWIAPATTNFITNELLTSDDEEIKAAARDYDWYIFPVTNPDGYVWSHVGFRLWRKNRKPYGTGFGVDLNRNWNDNWLKESVSTNVASDIYAGPGPFSEIETRTLSTYIKDMADRIDFLTDGQRLSPTGSQRKDIVVEVVRGEDFATGTSVDWVKERLHVPLTYCYELRDRGVYGHLLPPEQILPTGEETMDSIVEMILQARRHLEDIQLLQDLYQSDNRFDFWTVPGPAAEFVNVLSSPEHRSDFEKFLVAHDMDYEIPQTNIQEDIDRQTVTPYTRNNLESMDWENYHDLDAINAWMDDLAKEYPSIVSIIIGGSTFEGRQIKGLKISHGSGRRIVFLEGGIHAREWISPATVTYITNELLNSTDEETMAAARDFDWYIFPVTNPDGYIYSHSTNRMWRKNRRPEHGVDLNRNWNNNWLVVGASTDETRDDYAGLGPFSEPETRTFSTYLASISDKIDLYLSFHSYGHLLLIPFGNTTEPLANYDDAISIGRRAMGALSVRYGTQYKTGNIAEAIYLATGGSIDWIKESLKIPLVYCYELRDNGTYGFVLPPSEIMPNNLEVMDSLLDLIMQAKRFGYMSGGFEVRASLSVILMALLAKWLYN
ncbi:unnamed protein product [Chrysodeixis includens]|uniref:Zinc carboxypeptidase A 1 n=1 Tax=Chrysodeixis includens TaxID=689277 RepID=A0A9N8L4J0_CHRIL|nr:unnamed protein product [Chrysodeixis includens]